MGHDFILKLKIVFRYPSIGAAKMKREKNSTPRFSFLMRRERA